MRPMTLYLALHAGGWASDFARTLPVLLAGCGLFWLLLSARPLVRDGKQTKTDQNRPAETTSAGSENPCVASSILAPGTTPDQIISTLSRRRCFRLDSKVPLTLPLELSDRDSSHGWCGQRCRRCGKTGRFRLITGSGLCRCLHRLIRIRRHHVPRLKFRNLHRTAF